MKWKNHALVAGSIATFMGLHPAEIAYCMAASGLPDSMEMIGKTRIIAHRTWTHELLLWLAPMAICIMFPHIIPEYLIPEHLMRSLGGRHGYLTLRTWVLFLPGALHLVGDVMTPKGIRVAGKNIALGLFSTGQPLEYIIAALFAALAVLYKSGLTG